MRFHPTEEQGAIQEAVRGTLADSWLPRLAAFVDGDGEFDPDSWAALMELGLAGLIAPQAQGGTGLGLVDAALVMEMAGHCAAAGPLGAQMLAGGLPGASGALDGVIAGAQVATFAWGGQWLPESWDLRFERGKIDGSVRFVLSAGTADLFIAGTQGGGLALVEKGEAVEVRPLASSDRTRRPSTVSFRGAPATMLCEPGDPLVDRIFDAALILTAAEALGGAQHCLDLSVAYAKEREQFGQPIGRFQALKHQLVDMAVEVESARALLWYAAYAQDADLPDRRRVAALAKAHIAERFESVARGAVAAHGGIGYTWEYGLTTWFRRSLHDHAWLGDPATHRVRAAELAEW